MMIMIDRMKYLQRYTSEGSVRVFRSRIKSFLEYIYNTEIDDLEAKADQYLSESHDVKADLENWYISIKNDNPLTIRNKLNTIKTFLRRNGIKFDEEFWEDLNIGTKGARAQTMDRIPTKDELKRLIMTMPIYGKALFLVSESSGGRIGELLQINLKDLDLTKDPARIILRGEHTKTHNSRIIFISSEAKEWISIWLKNRDSYIKKKSLDLKDTRLFPFTTRNAADIWGYALEKTDLVEKDSSTGRLLVHIHSLRKFFSTNMEKVGIPHDIVEAIMGHEGYL
jgi:integrase